ncbi:MAG: hypothetical protein PVG66_13185 [Chromatiales bacterium]
MIDSISANALAGLQRSREGMSRNAAEIASAKQLSGKASQKDLARSLVELNQHKRVGIANAKVLKTADEVLGSLIDVTA